ncbi:alpha/beta fold hydrolase [Methanobacterium sp.]|uniref:alpha/beta fold hydrolase n=1 Tax=Methanobacterium sp. TaxID=2164 RepID=UPI003C783F15
MSEIRVNGIKLNYIEKGEGFPLILIHGLSDDLRLWNHLIPELSRSYCTLALDLRGHGSSSKPSTSYSIAQFSRDIYCLLVKLNIKKAHFIGFSMGGAIAQDFAVKYPEMVSSLILISSFSYATHDLNKKLLKLRASLVEGGFAAFFDEIVPLILTQEFIRKNRAELEHVKVEKIETESREALVRTIDACLQFDIKDKVVLVSKPTLIISGKQDVLTLNELAEQTHRLINGSEYKIIENTGHNVLIPENRQYLLELILKFLNNV